MTNNNAVRSGQKMFQFPTMIEEQEHVKNLLLHTVTLLCKNSLQFEKELCVEGLLGVKVDASDVFFLHISERFRRPPCPGGEHLDSDRSRAPPAPSTAGEPAAERRSPPGEEGTVVTAPEDGAPTGASSEVSLMEVTQSDHAAAAVPITAGQRRVPRKPRSPQRSLPALQSENPTDSPAVSEPEARIPSVGGGPSQAASSRGGNFQSPHHSSEKRDKEGGANGQSSVPKLMERAGADDACTGCKDIGRSCYDGEQRETPWPNLVGQLGLSAQTVPYLDAERVNVVTNLTQAGCSTWPDSQNNQPQPLDVLISVPSPDRLPSISTFSAVSEAGSSNGLVSNPADGAPGGQSGRNPQGGATGDNQRSTRIKLASVSATRRYLCPICGVGFCQKGNVKRHIRTHTGEKPYGCPHCTASFAQSTHLKRHVRTHTEERPFKCGVCLAAFPRRNTLSTHMTTYHPVAAQLLPPTGQAAPPQLSPLSATASSSSSLPPAPPTLSSAPSLHPLPPSHYTLLLGLPRDLQMGETKS